MTGDSSTSSVKNITQMSNSAYNDWRLEDAWLDK
jgi:hypothetical protein